MLEERHPKSSVERGRRTDRITLQCFNKASHCWHCFVEAKAEMGLDSLDWTAKQIVHGVQLRFRRERESKSVPCGRRSRVEAP